MKTRGLIRAMDFLLMAIAAGSCLLLLQPLLRADPNPGDCTDECQNKLSFYSYAGNGLYFHFD
jgi:hypothetical protein